MCVNDLEKVWNDLFKSGSIRFSSDPNWIKSEDFHFIIGVNRVSKSCYSFPRLNQLYLIFDPKIGLLIKKLLTDIFAGKIRTFFIPRFQLK